MIYVLAYPHFDSKVAASIDRFRSAYEPERVRLVRPHLTLVFGLRAVIAEEVVAFCRHTTAAEKPFSIAFDRTEIIHDSVEETYKICMVCSEGSDAIVSLHRALYDGTHRSQLRPDIPFRPHMTIATDARLAILETAKTDHVAKFPVRAEIRGIDIVEICSGNLKSLSNIKFQQ